MAERKARESVGGLRAETRGGPTVMRRTSFWQRNSAAGCGDPLPEPRIASPVTLPEP